MTNLHCITTLHRPEKIESEEEKMEESMYEEQWTMIKPSKMVHNWSPINKQFYSMDDESEEEDVTKIPIKTKKKQNTEEDFKTCKQKFE